MVGEPGEVICPACAECSLFTIIVIRGAPDGRQNGPWAKCKNCGHLTEVTIVGRYAATDPRPRRYGGRFHE